MRAEIIAIGDELTSGQRLDTNSQWLSEQLGAIGIPTLFHTTVADDIDANVQAFRLAAERAELVLATGGLGPTADDLTRQAMSVAFQKPLVLDEASLGHIQQMFSSRGREMPERNRVQAMFPQGSAVVANPHGTAPGIDFRIGDPSQRTSRIFALPGVPAEMKEMWEETVRGDILQDIGGAPRVVRHHRLKCFGKGESDLEAMLPDLIRRGREPTVGITVSQATITLRVTSTGADDESCRQTMQPTIDTIRDHLGELVFGEEDDELEHAVTSWLCRHGKTFAVCECGSGGMISSWMNNVPDANRCFLGGVVVPNPTTAERLLGIRPETDLRAETANMAFAIRKQCHADFGLSISPFPVSPHASDAKIFLGLATSDDEVITVERRFSGHPEILKARAAKQSLDLLRLHLLRQPA